MTIEKKENLESSYFISYTDLRKYGDKEIMFALHSPGGGVRGEIAMAWLNVGGREIPQIQAYHDSWEALSCFSDLIDELSNYNHTMTPEDFINLLESFGFINTDSYKGDYIPEDTFKSYQKNRIRNKNLNKLV